MTEKFLSYEERSYNNKDFKPIHDCLAQAFQDVKYGEVGNKMTEDLYGRGGWNRAADELKGITMRLIGSNCVQFTYHRIQTGSLYDIERALVEESGKKFLNEVSNAVKKQYKKIKGEKLDLKKKKYDYEIEKYSVIQPEISHLSWRVGQIVARYLVKESCVYEINGAGEDE